MKVVVISQADPFFIPENVAALAEVDGVQVAGVLQLDARGAVANKKLTLLKWFGLRDATIMGLKVTVALLQDTLERIGLGRGRPRSLRAAAKRCGAEFWVTNKLHSKTTLARIEALAPDLLVSFSAPVVFKPKLLALAPLGAINLHCSLLPENRGLMPSFWCLFDNRGYTGATVHRMAEGIDDGPILLQQKIELGDETTMFGVLRKTKRAGGALMCETLRLMQAGTLEARPNDTSAGDYHTWPTLEEARAYRRRGYRLV